MKLSVALAAYNGAIYLNEQMDSILSQLTGQDELVISVDPSDDRTEEIVRDYAERDPRVRFVAGKGKGLIANFETAITACVGDVICLSDQDDIWLEGKAQRMRELFADPNITVVLHDAVIANVDLTVVAPSYYALRPPHVGFLRNLLRNSYVGCCMAFSTRLKPYVLPFPKGLPMHDQWIGMVGERHGKVIIEREKFLKCRRHGGNASALRHSSIIQMVKWRVSLLNALRIEGKRSADGT